jgi:hypothetical protein
MFLCAFSLPLLNVGRLTTCDLGVKRSSYIVSCIGIAFRVASRFPQPYALTS